MTVVNITIRNELVIKSLLIVLTLLRSNECAGMEKFLGSLYIKHINFY